MRRALVIAACLYAAAGCKKDRGPDVDVAPDTRGFPTASAAAGEYLEALVSKDWPRVCATRLDEEKRTFARMAGSCEKAFAKMFETQPVAILEGAKPSAERVRGNLAAVDFTQPGQAEVALTVYARRTAGGWLTADIPDEQAP